MADQIARWLSYDFQVCGPTVRWHAKPGLYIFATVVKDQQGARQWRALYVGKTQDFSDRLPTHPDWPEARAGFPMCGESRAETPEREGLGSGNATPAPPGSNRKSLRDSRFELFDCERGAVAPLSHFPPGLAGSEQNSLPLCLARAALRACARRQRNADLQAIAQTGPFRRGFAVAGWLGEGSQSRSRHDQEYPRSGMDPGDGGGLTGRDAQAYAAHISP